MTKTFCDKCKKECPNILPFPTKVTIETPYGGLLSGNGTYELCKVCKDQLIKFIEEVPYEF